MLREAGRCPAAGINNSNSKGVSNLTMSWHVLESIIGCPIVGMPERSTRLDLDAHKQDSMQFKQHVEEEFAQIKKQMRFEGPVVAEVPPNASPSAPPAQAEPQEGVAPSVLNRAMTEPVKEEDRQEVSIDGNASLPQPALAPEPEPSAGPVASAKGATYSGKWIRGASIKEKTHQDAYYMCAFKGGFLAACADGHGEGGEMIAQYCIKRCIDFAETTDDFDELSSARIYDLFENIGAGAKGPAYALAGSTLTICFIGNKFVRVAWVGDSDLVYVDHDGAYMKTKGHTVASERHRMQAAGAVVCGNRTLSGINLSRSIGDSAHTGVISTPTVSTPVGRDKVKHLILGSDGLWDGLEGAEWSTKWEPNRIAELAIARNLSRTLEDSSGRYTYCDDVTICKIEL